MSIYLTVVVKAKPEHQQEIKKLLYSLPELSIKEETCIRCPVGDWWKKYKTQFVYVIKLIYNSTYILEDLKRLLKLR